MPPPKKKNLETWTAAQPTSCEKKLNFWKFGLQTLFFFLFPDFFASLGGGPFKLNDFFSSTEVQALLLAGWFPPVEEYQLVKLDHLP